jgi:RNA polymerase sigma factor (sigma-70 family)
MRRLSRAAAEDFAHDALLLFLEALREGRIQEPSRLASFALGICRNLARERARLGERRRDLLNRYGLKAADLADWDAPMLVQRDHLEDCYSQLTERARRVLRATFCLDADDHEIARELSLSVANVRVIRHRTLATLRICLDRPVSWVEP